MTSTLTLDDALNITKKHNYSGTTDDIVTLSLTISRSKKLLDKSVFKIFTEKSNITPKIFSNLKKIGDVLDTLPIDAFKEVCRGLPASYRSIYTLCSLRPDELKTAVKNKSITKDISYREADYLVKQIRFPYKLATHGDKGRWSIKQEHLYSIYRTDDVYLGGERLHSFEDDMKALCKSYKLTFRKANQSISLKSIREQERRERALYWRQVLEKEITASWFLEQPDDMKKYFNLRNVDELIDAPIRIFTGFIMRVDCGRSNFYTEYGKAYIAKLNLLMERTTNNANRYSYRDRIKKQLSDKRDLLIWHNLIVKSI